MNKRLTIFIFILTFWIFWLPGVRVATDYHLPQDTPAAEQILPWIFRETNVADGLGEYTGITLWSQPLQLYSAILSALSIPYGIQTKILVLIIFILGFISIAKLLKFLNINSIGKYVGIFFYLSNTFFLLLLDGGQLSLALTYSIFPLAIYFFLKTFETTTKRNILYLALSVLAVSIFDIRFIYILFGIFFIYFLTKLLSPVNKIDLIKQSVITALVLIIVLIGFHAYWLVPSIYKQPQLPQTYERTSQIDFLSFATIEHSILLQQPHWYKNIFGFISPKNWEFILIPILAFLAPFLNRKDPTVIFWLIIALIGIFLGKGSQEPLPHLYTWLFDNIPGFSLFRDPVKFFILIALSYSILIAKTFQGLERFKTKNKFLVGFFKIAPYLALIYFIFLMNPIFTGKMTGLFSFPFFEKQFTILREHFLQDKKFSRIFWLPSKAPLGFSSDTHPSIEAGRAVQKRPFAIGTKGQYETFNFLREAPFMGEIFDISSIGYIVYSPLNPKRDDMHPDNVKYFSTFSNQLTSLPWLTKVDSSPIPLWKINSIQDKFFITPNIWWVIGSDDIYNEATKSAALRLSNNAIIFPEEKAELGQRINQLSEAKVVLNRKNLIDLAVSFIDLSEFIFPARNLDFEPDQSGWWKREAADLIRWRDFLQNKYLLDNQDFDLGGGWAIAEGKLDLMVKDESLKAEEVLLARVFESSKSGSLSFYQDGDLVGKVTTQIKDNKTNVRWFEVGRVKNNGDIHIQTEGDINIVNALVAVDYNQWQSFKQKAEDLQNQGRIVNFDASLTVDKSPEVSYRKINPTKYEVEIKNIKKPIFLVFSENYDSFWKLNGQAPYLVYSLLNGYQIEKDGTYIVEYELQKYVYFGLIITTITSIALIFLLFKAHQRPAS